MNIINYQEYLQTEYWKEIREQVYKRDEYKCRLCNSDNEICVHHRTYEFIGNEDINELVTLCKKCHYNFHKHNNLSYKDFVNNHNLINTNKKYTNIVIEYEDKFTDLYNILLNNTYILHSEYKQYIKKIIKNKCVSEDFIYFIMKYQKCLHVYNYDKSIQEKYNLPEHNKGRCKEIIVFEDIIKQDINKFSIMGHMI